MTGFLQVPKFFRLRADAIRLVVLMEMNEAGDPGP
jgi:hypothetical protein